MSNLPYKYTIGLEIHCELATATKMFCRCKNAPFGAQPNENTCPVCMGLPGTLPVPNREAVRKTVLVGKALGSTINELAKWDRKHYFYPDLPKGYQISQYDLPFCVGGELALLSNEGKPESVIHFERVHLEEDAGKLMHTGRPGYSKVDLNRAGVPLIEMVTKPDIHSPEEARRFMQELRQLVRTLGVSEADMEKGEMRADVNVSIQFEFEGQEVSTPITEVKNVNSTRAVERCLIAEGQRLYTEWQAGGPVRTRKNKLTASWDEDKNQVNISRAKEAANEYRYFPEPDIPPVKVFETEDLNPDKMELPELPNHKRLRYLALGLSIADCETILNDDARLARFESLQKEKPDFAVKTLANWIINAWEAFDLPADFLWQLMLWDEQKKISFSAAKKELGYFAEFLAKDATAKPETVVAAKNLLLEHDDSVVQSAIAQVMQEQPQAVQQFKEGKEQILGFLVGQVMQKTAGKAQPAQVQIAVRSALNNHK